ncbi:MAG: two-component regulator propeller domain-containing protein [Flavitalea sp.]
MKTRYFLLLLFVALQHYGVTQTHYYFKHYEVEHGLSNNIVISSLQDKKGFMWFGTIDGLNRFDGYTFQTFRSTGDDPNSIGNNSVYSICQDENEIMWFATNKGIYRYDPVVQQFQLLPFTKNLIARSLFIDKRGNLWFTLHQRLFCYSVKSGVHTDFPGEDMRINSICGDEDGFIWVGDRAGILRRIDPDTRNIKSFDLFANNSSPASRSLEILYSTRQGSILVGTLKEGMKLFDLRTGSYRDIHIFNPDATVIFARDFLHYSGDIYWIATETGILVYNLRDGSYEHLRRELHNNYSLSDNAINTLYKDNEGGIWAGTRFGGVSYYAFPYSHFEKYFSQNSLHSLSGNGVHEICPDNRGNLWIGTEDGGLNKMDLATGKFRHFLPDGKPGSISYYNIHGLLVDGDELWIGTYQYGIDRMDLRTEKVVRRYKAGKNSFKSNFIVHMFRSSHNEIYVGTWDGLFLYNRKTDSFSQVPGFEFQTQSMLEDKNGLLWICSLGNGVFSYDRQSGKITNFKNDPGDSTSLPSNMVNGQFLDSQGVIWFATEGGLSRFLPGGRSFETYTTRDGLPSNFLFKILEDSQHNLWISSARGLTRYDRSGKGFKTFTTANGLLNDQFNWNSAYKDSLGRMYFGSVKGMISFIPEMLTNNATVPPVYITGLQINNRDVPVRPKGTPLQKSILYTSDLTLGHKESTFTIDFAGLSYISPEINEYAYKMEGLDKEWTVLKSRRKAYFTELPAGSYTFRVKASNNSGVWNPHEATLHIVILPAFWLSGWAYLLYSLVGVSVLAFLVWSYHRHISEKNKRRIEQIQHEKENELYRNKIEFFTNIAHEIRTPLTLIQGPMEDILTCADEVPGVKTSLKIMERNTNRLLDIAEQMLDFRETEVRGFSLNFQQSDLASLLSDLHSSFTPLAVQNKLSMQLDLPYVSFLAMVDSDSLQKIIGNLYSNAIKYARSSVLVNFIFKEQENKLRIEFRSDGYLIPSGYKDKIFEPFVRIPETSHQKGTGLGLAISKTLAELNNGKLMLEPPVNGMNVFVLELNLTDSPVLQNTNTLTPESYIKSEKEVGPATGRILIN